MALTSTEKNRRQRRVDRSFIFSEIISQLQELFFSVQEKYYDNANETEDGMK